MLTQDDTIGPCDHHGLSLHDESFSKVNLRLRYSYTACTCNKIDSLSLMKGEVSSQLNLEVWNM